MPSFSQIRSQAGNGGNSSTNEELKKLYRIVESLAKECRNLEDKVETLERDIRAIAVQQRSR